MNVWIDVTDLMSWSGHFTGIQRVVFNIASRIQRDTPGVKLFYYDDTARKFYEKVVNLDEWLIANDIKSSEVRLTAKEKLINKIPHRMRKIAPTSVKKLTIKTGKYVLAKKAEYSSVKFNKNIGQQATLAEFGTGDKVFVLGNGWDKQSLLLDLGNLRQVNKFKLINVVYDLIAVFEPQFFGGMVAAQYTNYLFEAVTSCDILLPISKSTENDIFRFCNEFGIPVPKTKIIRLGDEISSVNNPKKPKWLTDKNFILCVGTIEVRKNHTLLYYAYKNLINQGVDVPKLVIVGRRGWYTSDTMMLFEQDTSMRGRVQILENTSDNELDWLYDNCMFTVYPSLYEGWGLPVAESLARGKVVLSSNTSSMPEVGGQLADYFSPYDAIGCSELINKYLSADVLKTKQKLIVNNYKITTWESCYKQINAIIQDNL